MASSSGSEAAASGLSGGNSPSESSSMPLTLAPVGAGSSNIAPFHGSRFSILSPVSRRAFSEGRATDDVPLRVGGDCDEPGHGASHC